MLDSTARAERIDLTPSEGPSYIWEVAQKPVRVRLPLALIDRLESEAVETFRSLSSRGSEIGGLLLGSTAPGSPALVSLADFELIPCDYTRGPLYRLSEIDLGRFAHAIEKHASGSGQRVVGYFRSHTRKGLTLDAEDLSFFEPRFVDPNQILLLIRPFATKASSAAIFLHENGRLNENSPLEFPFRASELLGGAAAPEKGESGASTTAAPPAASKQSARAQIVPIASRREITMPEPAAPAQSAAPIAASPVEAPAPQAKNLPAAPPPEHEKPSKLAASSAVEVEKPTEKTPEKTADKSSKNERLSRAEKAAARIAERQGSGRLSTPETKSEPEKIAEPERKSDLEKKPEVQKKAAPEVKPAVVETLAVEEAAPAKSKKLGLIVAAAVAMMLIVVGIVFVLPALRGKAPKTAAVQQDSSPLSLRVERTAGGMLLSWDLHSPVILGASKVMLAISDGERHENIQLDPNQVRTGSILYPPMTGDVSFQMEVTDSHNAKTTSESLRVLDPRPSPLADPAESTTAAANKPSATNNNNNKPATNSQTPAEIQPSASNEESKPVEETPARPALKKFNTESLAERLRPVTQADLPDAPTVGRSSNAAPVNLPGMVGNPGAPLPPPRPAPAPAAAATTQQTSPALPSGGQLTPAVVVTRVEPEYPRMARQAGATGLVELEATIGADGKVKNPRVLRGNTMLQKAAIDAVLQWKYRPAMLNGKPVESPVEIKLNFVAAHN